MIEIVKVSGQEIDKNKILFRDSIEFRSITALITTPCKYYISWSSDNINPEVEELGNTNYDIIAVDHFYALINRTDCNDVIVGFSRNFFIRFYNIDLYLLLIFELEIHLFKKGANDLQFIIVLPDIYSSIQYDSINNIVEVTTICDELVKYDITHRVYL